MELKSAKVYSTERYRIVFEMGGKMFLDAENGATKLDINGTGAIMASISSDTREDGASGLLTKSCSGLKMTGDEAQILFDQKKGQ